MNRLKDKYINEVRPKLLQELGLKNQLSAPTLTKVVISIGLAEAKDNKDILEKVSAYLKALTGQKPKMTFAKHSIAAFKLSQGDPIGLMVTLRGDRMYSFLDKLFNICLPRVRDFKGVSRESFDRGANFNLGLKEQLIFPEVDYKMVDKTRGMAVTFVTTGKSKDEGMKLLEYLGMPFVKN